MLGCTSPPEIVTTGENGSPCVDQSECFVGRCIASLGRCTDGQVGSMCAGDPDCSSSGSCVLSLNECTNGTEGSPCDSNEQCSVGCVLSRQECTGGSFDDPCDDATDCGSAYSCSGGRCVNACRSDCDCLSNEFCYRPAGGGPFYCADSTTGSRDCFVDVVGRTCTGPSTCTDIPSGYCGDVGAGSSGICTAACTSHWNCGCPYSTTDADIDAFRCDAACVPSSSGTSYCWATCLVNADCPPGALRCSIVPGDPVGLCVPPT